jgi:hypothetical protein
MQAVHRHLGQASVEFLVCAGVLAAALLIPIGESGSAAARLLDAIARFHRNHVFLVALS